MNISPCLTWVRRGVAKGRPDKVQLNKEELKKILEETKEDIDDLEDEIEDFEEEEDSKIHETKEKNDIAKKSGAKKAGKRSHADLKDEDDIVKKYGLDEYDEDDTASNPLKGIGNLTFYSTNDDDPYITLKDEADSDDEDFEIKPTDNLLIAGRAEDDSCCLDIYVYNENESSFYVHHDIMLMSFPLCLEWMNFDPGEDSPGNFVAVGTMEPVIEIWDVDVVDALEPVAVLGAKSSKKKRKKTSKSDGHTDAVLGLSWNVNVRNALASASADCTVALWDISEGKVVTSIAEHKDKVQCICWHTQEPQTLLSGSFDKTVKIFDCRNPKDNVKSWSLDGEIENILWDKHCKDCFFASTDKGKVYYLDSRKDKPVYTLSAHSQAVTGISQSSSVKGLLTTASTDKSFKVWDVHDNRPSMVYEKNMKNELMCLGACQESPFVFAIGGNSGVKVWDIRESAQVRKHFKSRVSSEVYMEGDGDVDDKDDATTAMETLSIDQIEADDKEYVELMTGAAACANATVSGSKKKKKKKKKKSK